MGIHMSLDDTIEETKDKIHEDDEKLSEIKEELTKKQYEEYLEA